MKILWMTVLMAAGMAMARGEWKIESRKTLAELPNDARLVEISLLDGARAARVHAFVFTDRHYRFAVVDNPDKSTTLATAMQAAGAEAGVNGGYFAQDFSPVGLLVAAGTTIHPFQKAKLLSGVLLTSNIAGKSTILSAEKFSASAPAFQNAIQCGPNLVRDGKAVGGLNSTAMARRTTVSTDGRGKWALINITPVTLADAGQILATANLIPELPVRQALNLDGGSSTAMWVKTSPTPFYLASFAIVRNYLAVLAK